MTAPRIGARSAWMVLALCWLIVIYDGYDLIVYGTTIPALIAEKDWHLSPDGANRVERSGCPEGHFDEIEAASGQSPRNLHAVLGGLERQHRHHRSPIERIGESTIEFALHDGSSLMALVPAER